MKKGRPKGKIKKAAHAVWLNEDLHAQAMVIFAKNRTNFSAEVAKWLEKLVKANLKDSPELTLPPVDKIPEEEKVTVTKVEVPAFVGKKPESDWF